LSGMIVAPTVAVAANPHHLNILMGYRPHTTQFP
jgi:hypothetical protein